MAHVSTSQHTELAADLRGLVRSRLLDPLEILVDAHADLDTLHHRIDVDAQVWAARLLGRDDALAARTAVRVLAALYPGDAPFDPPDEWWRTPLGRAVARRLGHPAKDRVSYAVAGAMLGITRQGVHDLVRRGKLTRHPDGGVTSASVRDRLRTFSHPPRTAERTPTSDGH